MAASPKVSFRLQEQKLSSVDYLIKYKHYKDRSAFFNAATKLLLEKHQQKGDL